MSDKEHIMDIQEIAQQIATAHDLDEDGALSVAKEYVRQIEDLDHRKIDPDNISAADAETIIGAASAGLDTADPRPLDDLYDLAQEITGHQDELESLTTRRNGLIRKLLDDGFRVADIAEATGLNRSRIYAIRDQA